MSTSSSLVAFIIFNPLLGDENNEQDKILACYPKINIEIQKMHVGLAEGLIGFTREYSPDKPIESMQTEKHRYAFYECELDFWIIMIISNPSFLNDDNLQEYNEDELDDNILLSLVKHAYNTYSLFNGKLTDMMKADNSTLNICRHLDLFLQYYLSTVKFNQLKFFIDLTGFQFFPVDKPTYMMASCIFHTLTTIYGTLIESCSLFYDSKLIWSNIEQSNMRVLYNILQENFKSFFTYFCLNDHVEDKQLNSIPTDSKMENHSGVFLTGPLKKGIHTSYAPRCYLNKNGSLSRLVIYQIGKLSLMMVLHGTDEAHYDMNFYNSFEIKMGPELKSLNSVLAIHAEEDESLSPRTEDNFRFLYFNSMNLALKSSLYNKNSPLSVETIKVLRNMHSDFENKTNPVSEIIVKTRNDGWVIGRRSTQTNREFFVLIDDNIMKTNDITLITNEVDRLAANNFNIFIQKVAL